MKTPILNKDTWQSGENSMPALQFRIPKVAHFTWLGGPLPGMAINNIDRFRQLHPSWAVRIWTGVPSEIPSDLVEIIYSTKELCMRSDIIRAWLLFEFGGVYLDVDVYALRPLDNLLECEHFVARRLHGTLNNAVMGAVRNSRLFSRIVAEIREKHKKVGQSAGRHDYGPNLLARIRESEPHLLNILPAHYFYIFQTHETAIKFVADSPEDQAATLLAVRSRISDEEEPFAVHTWGIPKEEMPDCYPGRSSWTKPLRFGDAILRSLANRNAKGLIWGELNARLPAHLLGHQPNLHLTIVTGVSMNCADRSTAGTNMGRLPVSDPEGMRLATIETTEFARERCTVLDSSPEEVIEKIPDRSLDCIILGANSYSGDTLAIIDGLLAKLKPQGFICGLRDRVKDNTAFVQRSVCKLGGRLENGPEGSWFLTANDSSTNAPANVFKHAARRLPNAKEVPFAAFANRYAGRTCYVVGRGPTDIWFEDLGGIKDPVFFINDAVCLEKYIKAETFFFAHDAKMLPWLNRGIRATAVLPADGKLLASNEDLSLGHSSSVVWYHWRKNDGEKLLRLNRSELAAKRELYTNTGTIHSLLHFVWFCGFKRVIFIGCDGIHNKSSLRSVIPSAKGYDTRLQNLSRTAPWNQYDTIRRVQDRLCRVFGFETSYVGTCTGPAIVQSSALVPKIAHFTWVGGPLPKLAEENIEQFKRLHPDWETRVWMGVPKEMPDDLVNILYSTNGLSMRSDVIRFWLMQEYGGIYLDTDIYTLRNMEELRGRGYFVTYAHRFDRFYVGVIGAPPRSAASEKVMAEIRETYKRRPVGAPRCDYGPDLIKRVQARNPELFTILPKHYFYIIKTHETAIKFIGAGKDEQVDTLEKLHHRITDGVVPYAVHTSGIPQSMSHPYYTASRSSWEQSTKSADAILRRLPNRSTKGALLGTSNGRFAAYLLGHHNALELTMVGRWQPSCTKDSEGLSTIDDGGTASPDHGRGSYEMAFAGTEFAAGRRRIICSEPGEAAAQMPDHYFDWVFVHDCEIQGGLETCVRAWLPKVKSDGFVCGCGDADSMRTNADFGEAVRRLGLQFDEAVGGMWLLRRSSAIQAPTEVFCR